MKEQPEPFTREQVIEAFSRDYAGKPDAVEKKWQRDKAALLRLGVALHQEEAEQTRYLVERTALHLAPLRFEPAEAAVVWMAGRAALRAAEHPLRPDLESALRKLVVGASGLPATAPTAGALTPPPAPERLAALLETLADAVERRRRLHLVYRGGPDGGETARDVDVFGYGLRDKEWFFVGHCHLRNARRIFLLARVVKLEKRPRHVPGHACLVPVDVKGGDYRIPADFDLDAWRAQRPWEYLAHPPLTAQVRFRGTLARRARALAPRGRLAPPGADGSRDVTLAVRDLGGLVRQVLAWGAEAELLSPPEGRAALVAALDRLAAAHAAGEA
jgi:proteasome accessory factor B